MGELADWANKKTPFIKLEDGQSCQGVYCGYEFGEYQGNKNCKYQINIDGDMKTLTSSSGELAREFDGIKIGSEIRITRIGVGKDTKYRTEIISAKQADTNEDGSKTVWDEE